ncbi:MAG: hypothetical protein K5755_05395 [Clostridiales bacterium]|nr:hypothetical protein [Clostridiales bacterium]
MNLKILLFADFCFKTVLCRFIGNRCRIFSAEAGGTEARVFAGKTGEYIAARDPIGIRPLYYGYDGDSGK